VREHFFNLTQPAANLDDVNRRLLLENQDFRCQTFEVVVLLDVQLGSLLGFQLMAKGPY
jgi:hypothetical protein